VPSKESPLQVRHEAAIALVVKGELDPYSALALVCWPRKGSPLEDEQVPPGKQFYSDDVREEIRRRHAAGDSSPSLRRRRGSLTARSRAFAAQRVRSGSRPS
jgi:hypothetical protein